MAPSYDEKTTAPQARGIKVYDELGRLRTLEQGATAWQCLRTGSAQAPCLLLGLGPNPKAFLATKNLLDSELYYVESAAMQEQLDTAAKRASLQPWQRLPPDKALAMLTSSECSVWLYTPEVRHFSSFWGPFLGNLRSFLLQCKKNTSPKSLTVLLPGNESSLLTHEIEEALTRLGYHVARLPIDPTDCARRVEEYLRHERPALFCSVNLMGLDPEGKTFHLLQACQVPVAVWCVDNPWNIFSGLRLPWWKNCTLFVTDTSFIEPLRRHGADKVHHLPLAAWYSPTTRPQVSTASTLTTNLQPVVFVGRSAFPERERFFAGCHAPAHLLHKAGAAIKNPHNAAIPNFDWWGEQLGTTAWWPGNEGRIAAFGAEMSSLARRMFWLQTALPLGLTIFGDAAWHELLKGANTHKGLSKEAAPQKPSDTMDIHALLGWTKEQTPAPFPVDIRPSLDYYGSLAAIYAEAKYSLNITSLQLPAGLTQRHFDVWMAGGFLLTDNSPGLTLFPHELTESVALDSPDSLTRVIERFEKDPFLRTHLQTAWQNEIARRHTYEHRMAEVLTICQ